MSVSIKGNRAELHSAVVGTCRMASEFTVSVKSLRTGLKIDISFLPLNLYEISRFSYIGEKPMRNEFYAAIQNSLYLKLWIILMILLFKNNEGRLTLNDSWAAITF